MRSTVDIHDSLDQRLRKRAQELGIAQLVLFFGVSTRAVPSGREIAKRKTIAGMASRGQPQRKNQTRKII